MSYGTLALYTGTCIPFTLLIFDFMYCISLHARTTARTLKVSNILCLIQIKLLKPGDIETNPVSIENISPQNNCFLGTRLQRYMD